MRFLIVFGLVVAFTTQSSIRAWNEEKLAWSDFTVVDFVDKNEDARIHLDFSSPYSYAQGILKISVLAAMDKQKSVVIEGGKTDWLLNHEQGHFDLQELIARKFRREISSTIFSHHEIESQINLLFHKYSTIAAEQHTMYDNETRHSKNRVKQIEWDERIKKELEALDDFSNTDLIIENVK